MAGTGTEAAPAEPLPLSSYIAQMRLEFETVDGITTGRLPVVPALCRAPGLVRVGALTTLADCVAGYAALGAFDMAWMGTSELAIHGPFRPAAGAVAVATGRLLKRRRTGGVFEVIVDDEAGGAGRGDRPGPLATATATLTLLSRQPGTKLGSAITRQAVDADTVRAIRSLEDLVRPRPLPGGGLFLHLSDNIRNSWQVLSGGITALLAELAAESAASDALGRPCVVDGLGLHFLAPGRVGPIEARAEVVSRFGGDPTAAVHLRVRLTDAGAEDREVMAASATARPLG